MLADAATGAEALEKLMMMVTGMVKVKLPRDFLRKHHLGAFGWRLGNFQTCRRLGETIQKLVSLRSRRQSQSPWVSDYSRCLSNSLSHGDLKHLAAGGEHHPYASCHQSLRHLSGCDARCGASLPSHVRSLGAPTSDPFVKLPGEKSQHVRPRPPVSASWLFGIDMASEALEVLRAASGLQRLR